MDLLERRGFVTRPAARARRPGTRRPSRSPSPWAPVLPAERAHAAPPRSAMPRCCSAGARKGRQPRRSRCCPPTTSSTRSATSRPARPGSPCGLGRAVAGPHGLRGRLGPRAPRLLDRSRWASWPGRARASSSTPRLALARGQGRRAPAHDLAELATQRHGSAHRVREPGGGNDELIFDGGSFVGRRARAHPRRPAALRVGLRAWSTWSVGASRAPRRRRRPGRTPPSSRPAWCWASATTSASRACRPARWSGSPAASTPPSRPTWRRAPWARTASWGSPCRAPSRRTTAWRRAGSWPRTWGSTCARWTSAPSTRPTARVRPSSSATRDDYGIAQQNIQSRIRGAILMAISNAEGRLVLATGNKSELSVGYCTLYGDTVGGLAVLGDVYKKDVYALARRANAGGERFRRTPSTSPRPRSWPRISSTATTCRTTRARRHPRAAPSRAGLGAGAIEPPAGASEARCADVVRAWTATSTSAARPRWCCAPHPRPSARADASRSPAIVGS